MLTSVATGLPKGFGLAFNSVDGRPAVGFHDEPVLRLYNGATLTARDTTGIANGNLMSVAWRATGDTLYAGGLYHDGAGRTLLAWGHGGTAPRRVCGRATTP